jgi:bifunctional DNase/RNase
VVIRHRGNLSRTRIRSNRGGYFEDLYGGGWAADGFDRTEPSAEIVHETRELHALVLGALQCLPIEQRQAVRLHYLEGLRLWEMVALTKTPAGTLKARLHHAREKLRTALASQLGDVRLDRTGGSSMIEVNVHDVVLRAPKGEEAKWLAMPWDNSKVGPARVILLKERDGNRVLPLWVGSTEGDAIAMALEGLSTVRPTTFDLTTRLLEIGKVKINKVAVISLRVVFYCSISITAHGQTYEIDARPSDALALALLAKAPIYVTPQTFEQAAYCLFTAGSEIAEMEEFQRKWPAPWGDGRARRRRMAVIQSGPSR